MRASERIHMDPTPIRPPWIAKPISDGWWWYRDVLEYRHVIKVEWDAERGFTQYDPVSRSLVALPEGGAWCGPIPEPPDWA